MLKTTWSRGLALFVAHDVLLVLLLVWAGVVTLPGDTHAPAAPTAAPTAHTMPHTAMPPRAGGSGGGARRLGGDMDAAGVARSLFSADDVLELVNARLAEAEAERARAREAADFDEAEEEEEEEEKVAPRMSAASFVHESDREPLAEENLSAHARHAERFVAEKRGVLDTLDTDPAATDATVLVESANDGVASVCLTNQEGKASTIAASDVAGLHVLGVQSEGSIEFTTADSPQGSPYSTTFNGPIVSLAGAGVHAVFSPAGVLGTPDGVALSLTAGDGLDDGSTVSDGGNVVLSPGVGHQGGEDGEVIIDAAVMYAPVSELTVLSDGSVKLGSHVEAAADLTVKRLLAADETVRLAADPQYAEVGTATISVGGSVAVWNDAVESNPFFAGDYIKFTDSETDFVVVAVSLNFITFQGTYDGASDGGAPIAVSRKAAKLRAYDPSGSLWITAENEVHVAEVVAQGHVEGDVVKANSLAAIGSVLAVSNTVELQSGTGLRADAIDTDSLFARTGTSVSVFDVLEAAAGVQTNAVAAVAGDLVLSAPRGSPVYVVSHEDKAQAAVNYALSVTTNQDPDTSETLMQGRFFLMSAQSVPASNSAVLCLTDDGGVGYCSANVAGNTCVCTRIGESLTPE